MVAPATADLMAKMAERPGRRPRHRRAARRARAGAAGAGHEPGDVGARRPPSATSRRCKRDGVHFVGPAAGEMAEAGEAGTGRMAEPLEILAAAEAHPDAGGAAARRPPCARHLRPDPRADRPGALPRQPLLRPPGPRHRRGGGRGRRAGDAGLRPGAIPDPAGVTTVHVETARQMLEAVEAALPADVAVMAAAVADWRVAAEARRQDQEGRQRPAAGAGAHREPGHPGDRRPPPHPEADAGRRLRRRDRRPHRQCRQEARRQGRRLDPRQRRVAGAPASWAATRTPSISSAARASRTGRAWPRATSPAACGAHRASSRLTVIHRLCRAPCSRRGQGTMRLSTGPPCRRSTFRAHVLRLAHGAGLPLPAAHRRRGRARPRRRRRRRR